MTEAASTPIAKPPSSTWPSPGRFLETLAYTIDAERAEKLVATVRIDVTDVDSSFTLHIRHGATEFLENEPSTHDLLLALDRRAWAEIYLGHKSLNQQIKAGDASLTGDKALQESFLKAYHEVL